MFIFVCYVRLGIRVVMVLVSWVIVVWYWFLVFFSGGLVCNGFFSLVIFFGFNGFFLLVCVLWLLGLYLVVIIYIRVSSYVVGYCINVFFLVLGWVLLVCCYLELVEVVVGLLCCWVVWWWLLLGYSWIFVVVVGWWYWGRIVGSFCGYIFCYVRFCLD